MPIAGEEALPQGEKPFEVSVSQGRRQLQWQEMEQVLRGTTDGRGKNIDKGIVETVVAFNVLDVHTSQSCEGHLDWGTGAPWVDVKAPDIAQLEQEFDQLARRPREQQTPRAELQRISNDRLDELREQISGRNLEERAKLMRYLDEFYQDRRVPYDRILAIQARGLEVTRLQSLGAGFQTVAQQEVKQQKLVEYQQEMQAFGTFLKAKFFSSM